MTSAGSDELQVLLDEFAVSRVLARYPRAIDRLDHELLASLFHPDARVEYGSYDGPATGFVEFMRAGEKEGHHWMHHNGSQVIEVDGEVARAETYCLAFSRRPGVDGVPSDREVLLRVRYVDRLERREGHWRIAHRRVVYSPCQVLQVTTDLPQPASAHLEAGLTDAVYRWSDLRE